VILTVGDARDVEAPSIPYEMPGPAGPFNVPAYCTTPTPDGTGSALHTSVLDFGPRAGWHGWRYWAAMTPHFESNIKVEDPIVLVSRDGFTWRVPPGGTNPIYASPEGLAYHSDTDLTYDRANDRLILVFRETHDSPGDGVWWERLWVTTSADGVAWTPRQVLIEQRGADSNMRLISPALVQVGEGDWRLFTNRDGVRTSADPLGPWSDPTPLAFTHAGTDRFTMWHLDVFVEDGRFRMLGYAGEDGLFAGVSADGVAWTVGDLFLIPAAAGWDSNQVYRGSVTRHPHLPVYRLWYPGDAPGTSWRIGYTHVPRALWGALAEA